MWTMRSLHSEREARERQLIIMQHLLGQLSFICDAVQTVVSDNNGV